MSNLHIFSGSQVRSTARAILVRVEMVSYDGCGPGYCEFDRDIWFPKNLLQPQPEGKWGVPTWLAKDRGLINPAPTSKFGIHTGESL